MRVKLYNFNLIYIVLLTVPGDALGVYHNFLKLILFVFPYVITSHFPNLF